MLASCPTNPIKYLSSVVVDDFMLENGHNICLWLLHESISAFCTNFRVEQHVSAVSSFFAIKSVISKAVKDTSND